MCYAVVGNSINQNPFYMKIKFHFLIAVVLFAFTSVQSFAQSSPQNWFHLDPWSDKMAGVSDDRAYGDLLKGMESKTVIVAVIDGGVQVNHPDLADHIWINADEIANNQIDDDHNGYVDDVNGWDFIGGKDGTDVNQDNYELTRLYRDYKKIYDGVDPKSVPDVKQYNYYLALKTDYLTNYNDAKDNLDAYTNFMDEIKKVIELTGKTNPTATEISNVETGGDQQAAIIKSILGSMISDTYTVTDAMADFQEGVDQYNSMVNYGYNLDFDPRNIVGDNYSDGSEKFYGNNELKGPDGMHGTHVSGIIGAIRNNGIGMNGVCDNVKIMVLRVVPDGDERDKDVANAIRYAVDNGAKVINMSFGKGYSYNKTLVDDAVKYAADHDVLMVHAAGNDGQNNDVSNNFPNDQYADGSGYAPNWIEVGACGSSFDPANFSNYGKKGVDLFAPGEEIYSTVPDGDYKNLQGTSMASPVVAGVAALIRSYFPELTAVQVKSILMSSVTTLKSKVPLPGDDKKKTKYTKLCVSGGIVNAYVAVKFAKQATGK